MGIDLAPEEKFEVFGDFDPDQYAEETERRWGGTDACRESQRRTAGYGKGDWKRIKEELDGIHGRIADRMAAGEPADSPGTADLAEEHRQFISRTSYECDHAMHGLLGEMYVADGRFTATYEQTRLGLAVHVRDAIRANAARNA